MLILKQKSWKRGETKRDVIMVWKLKIISPELQEASVCEQGKKEECEKRIKEKYRKRGENSNLVYSANYIPFTLPCITTFLSV